MRRASSAFLLLFMCVLLQAVTVTAAEPRFFTDVPAGYWYAGPVMKLWQLGIVKGSGDDLHFRPDVAVTRAEFVKMLLLTDGLVVTGTPCTGAFADVPCDSWAAPYVELAFRLAVSDGVQPGRFDPGGLVTREQMVTMLERGLGRGLSASGVPAATIAGSVGKFTDADAVHGWARGALALAIADGVLQGTSSARLEPGRPATRAEAATVLSRAVLPHLQRGAAATVDGHNVSYNRMLSMRVTAYATGEPGVGDTAASGLKVRLGMVAVDPSVVPLGTLLYVEGYGYAIAGDTGGAIKGMRLDLFVPDEAQADAYGIQPHPVYIIEPVPPAVAGGGV